MLWIMMAVVGLILVGTVLAQLRRQAEVNRQGRKHRHLKRIRSRVRRERGGPR